MFRGFYTVGSGMIAQQRKTEMLANNMANANTPGYKAEQATIRSFPEMYLSSIETARIPSENNFRMKGLSPVGGISTGVYMQETLPLFAQGQLRETELTTDVALIDGRLPVDEQTGTPGAVFFRLESEGGREQYTKNGNFAIDASGFLTSSTGAFVLDSNGQRIALQNDDFRITDKGIIMEGETAVATLGISFAQRPDTLLKQGDGMFVTESGENLTSANGMANVTYSTQQGFLEGSNVDAARTMTDMLTAYRAFEANQKILQAYDRSMEKAVTEVGRVN
ncbi:flagellar hook-basal body protein [Sporosarcina sp. JAI121]|uniref:flagellar hook-basal body protein n=1 Tax=Sporosarcina sp. JAI121 TaxID=2723064 RepID=UPI0015C92881|nr:flagellar hook-basal body protein [Sporosarcina sp. JAI121]NYF23511.1 flagellar basal-body rod protein FlgG [Sporosarcina sp. JAI121]